MDDIRITPEQLKAAMVGEMDQLFVDMAAAMNHARAGRIIADSEDPNAVPTAITRSSRSSRSTIRTSSTNMWQARRAITRHWAG